MAPLGYGKNRHVLYTTNLFTIAIKFISLLSHSQYFLWYFFFLCHKLWECKISCAFSAVKKYNIILRWDWNLNLRNFIVIVFRLKNTSSLETRDCGAEAFCNFYYIYLFYNLQQRMGKKWVKNVFMIHETINLYDKYKFQAPLTY